VESVGARMVNAIRIVLAFSALVVVHIAASEAEHLSILTDASLIAYCAFSIIAYYISARGQAPAMARSNHWVDVCFYVYLVALTGGSSSLFFLYFLFPILVASFSVGYREGLVVTLASAVAFALVGVMIAPPHTHFGLGEALIRSVYLLALGYLIVYWGGYEITLKRGLTLLKEVNNLWDPRFGVDHTIGTNLDRLVDYFGASSCTLVLRRPTEPPKFLLYSASPQNPGRLAEPGEIVESMARRLLCLPETFAAAYRDAASRWRRGARFIAYDLDLRSSRNGNYFDTCKDIAELLETRAFMTVPYSQRDGTSGRLFLASAGKAFTQSDIEFLSQAAAAISPVVESMYLMDELVLKAAEHERFKISRDIHDTTIQPYIGLKLGLDALQRETGEGGEQARRIGELIEMANLTIRDLRTYAATLRDKASVPGDFLVSAVNRQAERFRRFYQIDVEVKSHVNGQLSNRLAAEAFQIVSEGLSNVLRHTSAKHAFVHILCEEHQLLLKVGNEAPQGPGPAPAFVAWSIQERASELGGTAFTERSVDGYTVVHVNIPI
ncbi:MAG TPA: histidine kinase, partial [Burkholderiales bacterium]|nr:histidine kinase [Burkholderiales bacterium]